MNEFLTASEIALELGITEATLYRWVKLGLFPRPMRLGLRQYRWFKKTVENHYAKLNEENNREKI